MKKYTPAEASEIWAISNAILRPEIVKFMEKHDVSAEVVKQLNSAKINGKSDLYKMMVLHAVTARHGIFVDDPQLQQVFGISENDWRAIEDVDVAIGGIVSLNFVEDGLNHLLAIALAKGAEASLIEGLLRRNSFANLVKNPSSPQQEDLDVVQRFATVALALPTQRSSSAQPAASGESPWTISHTGKATAHMQGNVDCGNPAIDRYGAEVLAAKRVAEEAANKKRLVGKFENFSKFFSDETKFGNSTATNEYRNFVECRDFLSSKDGGVLRNMYDMHNEEKISFKQMGIIFLFASRKGDVAGIEVIESVQESLSIGNQDTTSIPQIVKVAASVLNRVDSCLNLAESSNLDNRKEFYRKLSKVALSAEIGDFSKGAINCMIYGFGINRVVLNATSAAADLAPASSLESARAGAVAPQPELQRGH